MSMLSFRERGHWFVVGFDTDRLTDPVAIQQMQEELFSRLSQLPLRGQAVISFEGVEQASSQLVGLLLGAKKILDDRFGRFVLCRVGPHLRQILAVTRLDSQFEVRERLRDVLGTKSHSRDLAHIGSANSDMEWIN